jgi:PST family polysaccharide transporter
MQSIAWTGAVRWGSQIVTWGITILVARILSPEDYGIVGMAAVFFGLVNLVNDFGISTSLVILPDLEENQVAQINSVALIVGIVCFILSCGAAVPISWFYGVPELRWVVIVMSSSFLITAFRAIPQGLLEKELRFKRIALINGVKHLTTAVSTLTLALLGFGYWALVVANLVEAGISTGLTVLSRPHGFARPNLKAIKRATSVSSHITIGNLSWFVYSNADYVVAGRFLGKAALGVYNFAFLLASMPVDKITSIVTKVSQAFLSAVQTDKAEIRRYVLGLTEGLSLVTFPLTWGLALVAEDFVPLILGDHWLGLVAPLQILAFYSSVRSVTPVLAPVLNVTGQTRYGMRLSVVFAIVLPVGFIVATHWGVVGLALSWVVLHPFFLAGFIWRMSDVIDLPVRRYLGAAWPAFSSSALMAAALLSMRYLPIEKGWLLLALKIVAGAAVYVVSMMGIHRTRWRQALNALKRIRKRANEAPEAAPGAAQ